MPPNIADMLSQQGYGIPLLNDLQQQTPAGFITPQLSETGGFPIGSGLQEQNLSNILGLPKPAPNQVLQAPVYGSKRVAGGGATGQMPSSLTAGMLLGTAPTGTEEVGAGLEGMPIGQRILFNLASPQVQQAMLKKREMERKTAAAQVIAEVEGKLNQFLLKGDTQGATRFVDETVSRQEFMPELRQAVPKWYEAIRNKYYSVMHGRSLYLGLAAKLIDPLTGDYYPNVDPSYRDIYADWTKLLEREPNADIGEIFGQYSDAAQAEFINQVLGIKTQPTKEFGAVTTDAIRGLVGTQPLPAQPTPEQSVSDEAERDAARDMGYTATQLQHMEVNDPEKHRKVMKDIAKRGYDYRNADNVWHTYQGILLDVNVDKDQYRRMTPRQRTEAYQRGKTRELQRQSQMNEDTRIAQIRGDRLTQLDDALTPLRNAYGALSAAEDIGELERIVNAASGMKLPWIGSILTGGPALMEKLGPGGLSDNMRYVITTIEMARQAVNRIWGADSAQAGIINQYMNISMWSNKRIALSTLKALTDTLQGQREAVSNEKYGRPSTTAVPSDLGSPRPAGPGPIQESPESTPQKGTESIEEQQKGRQDIEGQISPAVPGAEVTPPTFTPREGPIMGPSRQPGETKEQFRQRVLQELMERDRRRKQGR